MKSYGLFALGVISGCMSLSVYAHLQRPKDYSRVVFDEFPMDACLFRQDVRNLIDPIIKKHGQKEWEMVVLSSEFHTHLGVYSVIGAKMGLRARDYFGAGLDRLRVTSFAGSKPPISCLNDGLQVSTGATLGHGTIALAENSTPIPKAHFSLGNSTICVELKEAYWSQARHSIAEAIEQHGLKSEEYWSAVRKLGIQCWLNWSRTEIFDLTVLDGRK